MFFDPEVTINERLQLDVEDPDMVGRSTYRAALEVAAERLDSKADELGETWDDKDRAAAAESVIDELEGLIEEAQALIQRVRARYRERA